MKKMRLLSIAAMCMLVFALTACGSSAQQNGGGNGGSDSEERSEAQNDAGTEGAEDKNDNKDENTDGSVKYEHYEELSSMYDHVFNLDTSERIYYHYPTWKSKTVSGGKDGTNGIAYEKNRDGCSIVTIANYESVYEGDIENILESVYSEFTSAAASVELVNRDPEGSEVSLITKREVVTLLCGVEAMKWEGTLPTAWGDDYEDYLVYGYTFRYQNMHVTFAAILNVNDTENPAVEMETLKDLVDKMVRTIRPTEE